MMNMMHDLDVAMSVGLVRTSPARLVFVPDSVDENESGDER